MTILLAWSEPQSLVAAGLLLFVFGLGWTALKTKKRR
jgi:hypothetical protein